MLKGDTWIIQKRINGIHLVFHAEIEPQILVEIITVVDASLCRPMNPMDVLEAG